MERSEQIRIANKIKSIRLSFCTQRRMAELICEEEPEFVKEFICSDLDAVSGNQMFGRDILEWAGEILNEDHWVWEDISIEEWEKRMKK